MAVAAVGVVWGVLAWAGGVRLFPSVDLPVYPVEARYGLTIIIVIPL
jgi:hypothetical protein